MLPNRSLHFIVRLMTALSVLLIIGCGDDDSAVIPLVEAPAPAWQTLYPQPQANDLNGLHMVDANYGFAVGACGTIMKTYNKGVSWQIVRADADLPALLAVDLQGAFGLAVGEQGSMLRSNNSGKSWHDLSLAGFTGKILGVDVVSDAMAVIVGEAGLIRRTEDGGDTWQVHDQGVASYNVVSFLDTVTGVVAGTQSQILWTGDGGQTWQLKALPGFPVEITCLAVTGEFTALIAVGENFLDDLGRVYTTADGGGTWVQRASDYFPRYMDLEMANPLEGFLAFRRGISRTSDGGITWSETPNSSGEIRALGVPTANEVVGVGRYGTIVTTDDGGDNWDWASQTASPTNSNQILNEICILDENTVCMAEQYGDLLRTTDGGQTWDVVIANRSVYDVVFLDAEIGMASSAQDQQPMFRTIDGGLTWTDVPSGAGIFYIHFGGSAFGLATGNSGRVKKSIDGGLTWDAPVSSPTGSALLPPFVVSPFVYLILGQSGTIYRSTDGGASWSSISVGASVQAIDFNADRSIGLVVGRTLDRQSMILRSVDAGASWVQIPFSAADLTAVKFAGPLTAYAVSSSGQILKTVDGGVNWTQQESPTSNYLRGMDFLDTETGLVGGVGGILLKTSTGGDG